MSVNFNTGSQSSNSRFSSSNSPINRRSPNSASEINQETLNSGPSTSEEVGAQHHLLRKRHSPNSNSIIHQKRGDVESTVAIGDAAAQTKLRKVSASNSSKAGNSSSQTTGSETVESNNRSGSSKQYDIPSSGTSSSGHRRNSQLKYLTDYFPNQLASDGHFTRLTRSKAKAGVSGKQMGDDLNLGAGSSSNRHRGSFIPVSNERHFKKSSHGHYPGHSSADNIDTSHRSVKTGLMQSSSGSSTFGIRSGMPPPGYGIPQASVLQFAPTNVPPPNVIQRSSNAASSSGSTSAVAPSYVPSSSGLLTAVPNPPLHFDLGNLPPSVIMSLPPPSAAASSSSRHNDISSFASQLAAAVVSGGVGPNSSGPSNEAQREALILAAAAAASSAGQNEYHSIQQHLQDTAAAASSSSSSIGINRSGLSFGSYALSGKGSSSVFALKSQHQNNGLSNRASSFLGSLVPRMQHLLSSSSSASSSHSSLHSGNSGSAATQGGGAIHMHHSSSRMLSLVEGLRSSNEIRQSEAASELAEMLLLGNEESLPTNMPVRDIIQSLCSLLQKDHNFELMLTAARCITNMQEALPRYLPVITEAIPLLLQKLKRIEYIDVAEQSLIALEVMSRRNAKNILLAGGIAATISHVDFFSLPSQRLAFQIAANCALYVTTTEFAFLKDCLGDLTTRLNFVDDKRCVESICTFFNRLIENVRHHPERLREIAGASFEFLKNVQQLLTIQPSTIGSNTFLSLLKSLRYMCTKCGELAVALIKMDFGRTIRYLLVGPEKVDDLNTGSNSLSNFSFEIGTRPAPQLREIIELIGELLPNLPNTEVFEVTTLLNHYMNTSGSYANLARAHYPFDVLSVNWYVMGEERGDWRLCAPVETEILEQAKCSGEQIVVLEMDGDVFDVDFIRMVRRSQTTGMQSALDRRITTSVNPIPMNTQINKYAIDVIVPEIDEREVLKRTKNENLLELIGMLFPLLVELGTVSTCSSLRFETLRVMMRMIYAVESETELRRILKDVPLAIYISSTLSSNKNLGVLVSALQLVHTILEKIPHLYVPLLESEGAFHEIRKLMKPGTPATTSSKSVAPTLISSSRSSSSPTPPSLSSTHSRRLLDAHHRHRTQHQVQSLSSVHVQPQGSQDLSLSSYLAAAAVAAASSGSSTASPTFAPQIAQGGYYAQHTLRSQTHLQNHPPQSIADIALHQLQQQFHMTQAAHHFNLPPPSTYFNSAVIPASVISQVNTSSPAELMVRAHAAVSAGHLSTLSPSIAMYPSSSGSNPSVAVNHHLAAASDAIAAAAVAAMVPASAGASSTSNLPNATALKQAIVERLQEFYASGGNALKYGIETHGGESGCAPLLRQLVDIAKKLAIEHKDVGCEPLNALKDILLKHEISAFQLNHSGITSALNVYLTHQSDKMMPPRKLRLRRFAALFMMLSPDNPNPHSVTTRVNLAPFERLISKVLLAIGQLEQFQVKVTNLSGGSGMANTITYLRGAQALRFFQTHQIRCNLKRHPGCKQLRDWRHGRGSIKVDPFTSISAIERYLVDRGIGIVSGNQSGEGDSSDNEDISDEEQDLSYSSGTSYSGRIELYIGDQRIASDISILQAIRQYSLPNEDDTQEIIPSSIWVTAHTLYYKTADANTSTSEIISNQGPSTGPSSSGAASRNHRRAVPSTSSYGEEHRPITSPPSRKQPRIHCKLSSSSSKKDKYSTSLTKNSSVFKDGRAPRRSCPLEAYLKNELTETLNDPSVGCLILLRTLYGLNAYWWALFDEEDECISPATHAAVLSPNVFHSSKLNSKVSRQLSDFLSVATQQIPKWTVDLVKAVPFAFPFMTRRNLFYCTAFGRDRALMHLVNEGSNDDHDGESTSRLIPRLERRKISINRCSLLKDAQQALTQLGSSKAMLEVGFEGEVGTGFGPTLEFYSTLSRELQKHSLKMWLGKGQKSADDEFDESGDNEYTISENGLYPSLHRPTSAKQMETRVRRFEFFGRLLAQSLLDSRMLDIPLAPTFFKWIIGDESNLGLDDLEVLEPTLYRSLHNMSKVDDKDFEDLESYFLFPGENAFEMVKGGKNALVTKSNFKQFIELICYWRLIEGVRPEMEAVRKGIQTVIPTESLKIFFPDEMEQLFCGCPESGPDDHKIWSKSALQQAIRPDHGFTHDSVQISWLVEMLHTFTSEKRRKFLQFVTGSPRLPVGGFRSLNPPLTVVRKTASYGNSENELPSAMTCYNYLKIPPYESYETFVERFECALQFIYSFHLT
ncbi:HECT-domain (ubiquitin-transferase) domain-containing protein [Ditylenchus destructor]|uniref:E3 ubiquitin-protein ligase n=1 Tax=Ditylenchus destructor TaxID=166010 RepID=A0AAD4N5H7_9BILA|nr:HECT-domain (ubiquitin-transferase) domain-containing protein [Ditylenchus destructor]